MLTRTKFAVKPHQRAQRALSKLLKPVDHRAVAGNARQSAQPCEQRIVGHIAQVAQAARADYQQTDHQQHQLTGAIIAAQLLRGKRARKPTSAASNVEARVIETRVGARRKGPRSVRCSATYTCAARAGLEAAGTRAASESVHRQLRRRSCDLLPWPGRISPGHPIRHRLMHCKRKFGHSCGD